MYGSIQCIEAPVKVFLHVFILKRWWMNEVKSDHTHNWFYELRIICLCLHEYIDSFCGSVENLFPLLSVSFLTKLWICSPWTQICGATSTIPKGQHWGQIWLEICLCKDWISHSSLIRGKCANPVSIQCRPCTVSDRKSIRGSLCCPGPVGQWAQYHSLHRQQCAGVRDSHTSPFDHITF